MCVVLCVCTRGFSSDLSLPPAPTTLICNAITQINQLRQTTNLLLHIDLPGPTHKHTTSACCSDRQRQTFCLMAVLWLAVHVHKPACKLFLLRDLKTREEEDSEGKGEGGEQQRVISGHGLLVAMEMTSG